MKATYLVHVSTGDELTDNDLERIRERIADSVDDIARDYLANIQVNTSHVVPGLFSTTETEEKK